MKKGDEKKTNVVDKILDYEVKMFLDVPTETEPPCRSQIDDMRLHRRSQFAGWSERTCSCYLKDLERAVAEGRNLLTLKYARMDNLVPALTDSPHIPLILAAFVTWQEEFIRSYPNIMKGGRDIAGFKRYMASELETYSTETLESLYIDVESYRNNSENMTRKVYLCMAELAGYESLESMETAFNS